MKTDRKRFKEDYPDAIAQGIWKEEVMGYLVFLLFDIRDELNKLRKAYEIANDMAGVDNYEDTR